MALIAGRQLTSRSGGGHTTSGPQPPCSTRVHTYRPSISSSCYYIVGLCIVRDWCRYGLGYNDLLGRSTLPATLTYQGTQHHISGLTNVDLANSPGLVFVLLCPERYLQGRVGTPCIPPCGWHT